jgi:hypothetical protein
MAQQQRRTLKPAGEVAGSRGLIERLIPPQPVPSTSKQQELSGNPLRSPLLSVLPASSPSPCSRCLGCHRLPRVRAQCIGTVGATPRADPRSVSDTRLQERHLPRRTRQRRVHCLPEPPGERVPTRRDPRQYHQRPSLRRGIHLHARKVHPPKRLVLKVVRTRRKGGPGLCVSSFLRAFSVANSPGKPRSSSGPKAGGVEDAQGRRS